MDSKERQEHLKPIAREILDVFSKIAESARAYLASPRSGSGAESLANPDAFNSEKAVRSLEQGRDEIDEACRRLSCEPAIARVVVGAGNDKKITYFICRGAPPASLNLKEIELASYLAPVGRLAALRVGEEETVLRGGQETWVEVLEKARRLQPKKVEGEWDSENSIFEGKFEGESYGPLDVPSLLALLSRPVDESTIAPLDRLLDEEREAESVLEGIHRGIITKAGLRDQPILDRYQDDIFRLPLNSRLLIMGAPGTGKTTTLIRRLGQKLNWEFLNDGEKQVLKATGAESNHARSWIMFTPTELLKHYVREAFNREDIPAPNKRIRTWDNDFRNDLARDEFGILRSATGKSRYVMKNDVQTLKVEINLIDWFTDFDEWQKTAFLEELCIAAKKLNENSAPEVAHLSARLLTALDSAGEMIRPGTFIALMEMANEIREYVKDLKNSSDEKIRGALNSQINKDRNFLDDLVHLIERLSELSDDPEDQDAEDEDEDENEGEPIPLRIGRKEAVRQYMQTIRSQARARARSRNVSKTSRAGRIMEWLGDRSLPDQDMKTIGESLLVQSALRQFVNPVHRYINRIPMRYRRFRRARQSENRWYRVERFNPADIHPLEVDILLLAMMRGTDDLIRKARVLDSDDGARASFDRLRHLYRTQVLADEATDFSPIQLACMVALTRPETRSFFACGDFNQRVTEWGTRSKEQMEWAVSGINIRTISVPYRQSQQLRDFARQMVILSGGSPDKEAPSDYIDNEGVPPVLALGMIEESKIAKWLAARIRKIEKFRRELPSIAVLVNSEEEVKSIAAALDEELTEQNIQVIACLGGKVLGRDGAVRVFNVEHIKGLEFEAVFFIGVDRLAEIHPESFDKYLYVGATRAATYLGITCEQSLPPKMAGLKDWFESD
ncbi:MAG: ATP-binding domain-containing protein [Alphaproteobacteria bacterium]